MFKEIIDNGLACVIAPAIVLMAAADMAKEYVVENVQAVLNK